MRADRGGLSLANPWPCASDRGAPLSTTYPSVAMARPLTHVRLEPTTAQYLRRCVALAWYCDEARDYESLLGPILRRHYKRLRQRARDRGGDPE